MRDPSPMSVTGDSGAFDPLHPPDAALIGDCVHCGFCLTTCPTYALWGEEADSPRGRIHLTKLALEGEIPLDETFTRHLDACLGCMACVTSCPSGVRYDQILEPVRAQIERNAPRTRTDRLWRALLFQLLPHPRRLRVAAAFAWAYQRSGVRALLRRAGVLGALPPRLRALASLLPDLHSPAPARRPPVHLPPRGEPRLRVALLTGCVQSVFFSGVNVAAARVLAAEGCDVVVPRGQGCCGALSLHSGRDREAAAYARRLVAAMEDTGADAYVTGAAGCGSTLKGYGELLADDPQWAQRAAIFESKVRDVNELLASLEPRAPRNALRARVVYHDACHLAHAQAIRAEPRTLLRSIPGIELVEVAERELCCGSAGIYNLLEPEAAADLGRRKAGHVRAAGADLIVTANPGCLLQLRQYLGGDVPLLHPVELLDQSLRGVAVAVERGRQHE